MPPRIRAFPPVNAPTRERANETRTLVSDVVNLSLKRSGRHAAADAPSWARSILDTFRVEDIRNLVFLPDTVMGRLLALAEEDPFFRLIGVHREEEAVGILAGLFLGNQRGAMLIQSSGLGNTLNALGSLAMAYRIPFPLLVSLRANSASSTSSAAHGSRGARLPGCADHPPHYAPLRGRPGDHRQRRTEDLLHR